MDGISWYSYVGNNPINRTDPLGLAEAPEEGNDNESKPEKESFIDKVKEKIKDFIDRGNKSFTRSLDQRGLPVPNRLEKYKEINLKVFENAFKFVGSDYYSASGRLLPTQEGGLGLDCSETVLLAARRASGVDFGDYTAHELFSNPELTIEGTGGIGSLNFYDWDGNDKIDHVTVVGPDGIEIHASERYGIVDLPKGRLENYAKENIKYRIYNKEFNWDSILK